MSILPKISIITPSFNSVSFIEQTIDSVLSQAFPNLEYIIIDGGSTDGTVDLIKKYENYLTYWISESDKGQSHAINKGITRATGDIINWLNADDYYEPDTLRTVSAAFENPHVRAYGGRSRIFNDRGTIRYSNGSDVYEGNLAKTIGMARIDQPETFFHREAWQKVGLLNENLHYTMDKEWWVRFLFTFGIDPVLVNQELLVNFRYHGRSKTVSKQEEFFIEGFQMFFQLADDINDVSFIETVENVFFVKQDKNYSIKYGKVDPFIAKAALNYTLLYLADYLYYSSKFSEFKKVFGQIDKKLLVEQDLPKYNGLKFRTNHFLQLLRTILKRNG